MPGKHGRRLGLQGREEKALIKTDRRQTVDITKKKEAEDKKERRKI
jgi:hypothetical protein